jgi:type I restriction enzyme, S subunit
MAAITSENDLFSEDVELVPLGELGKLFTGYPTYRLRGEIGVTVPTVGVRDVENVNNPYWQLSSLMIPDAKRVERYRLDPEDVVVTAKGASFKAAMIPERWRGAVLSSNLIGINVGERLRPEILLVFLESAMGQQIIERRLARTGLLNLSIRDLSELEVPVPPLAEQKELAELIKLAHMQREEALQVADARVKLAYSIVLNRLHGQRSNKDSGENH